MHVHGPRPRRLALLAIAILFVPTLTFAQDDVASRLDAMQKRLDALDKEAAAIRGEIEALRAQAGVAKPSEPGVPDLMSVAAVPGELAAAVAPAPEAQGSIAEVQVLQNATTPGASKIFNPDMSVIGNVIAHAGDVNENDPRDSIALEESELALEAAIDPYAKAKFFLSFGEHEVSVEEGYAQFTSLPWDLTMKVGKMKAAFGKLNTQHPHVWPTIDAPLVNSTFFGDGLADSGVSVSKLIPAGPLAMEATAEVFRGSVDGVFEPKSQNDMMYVGHLKAYHDITENSNVEIGGSWARGTLPESGLSSEFTGVDLTYRWKPLARSIYNSLIARGEAMLNDRDGQPDNALGLYVGADYQFAQRWLAGFRVDSVERPDDPSIRDRGESLTLTFRPSEFSLIRGQVRRTDYGDLPDVTNEFLLQLQFGIGAHGAHPF